MTAAKATYDTHKKTTATIGPYAATKTAYEKNVKDIADDTQSLVDNKYRGAIMLKEATSDGAMEIATKLELDAVTALIGFNGTENPGSLPSAPAASGLKKKINTAEILKTCAGNAAVGTCSGSEKLFSTEEADQLITSNAAEAAYEEQIKLAAASASAGTLPAGLAALNALLKESAAFVAGPTGPLTKATADYKNSLGLIKDEKGKLAAAVKAKLGKIVECEAEKYNAYMVTLDAAVKARAKAIADIVKLLDERVKPEPGAKDWRCEKGLSNGTFRPMRNEKTCATGLCCGAAKVVRDATQPNVVMTIETCQTKTDKTYSYIAPRTPL